MNTDEKYWNKVVSKIIKSEMAKRGIDYPALVVRLGEIDVKIVVSDLRARVSRGNFGAILFVQCLRAMGVTDLLLEECFFKNQNSET